MTIALLAINAKYVHSSLPIWCIADGVKQHLKTKANLHIIEATINQSVDSILSQLTDVKPEIIGISTYIWNADILREILGAAKQLLPNAKIVLGGPEASHNPKSYLSVGADFIIRGAGERSFPALIDAIATGADLGNVAGLCYLSNGEVVVSAADNGSHSFDNTEYCANLHGRIAYIEASRGCPFSCAFCLSGDSKLEFFPLDAVRKQLQTLVDSGAKTIKFVDRTFNCNRDRADEIIRYIINLNTDCTFHLEVAPDLFDGSTIALLATAPPGRIQLEAGLQSFNPKTLEAVSRKANFDTAEKNITAINLVKNIHLHLDLIAGLPYETLETFKAGFNRAFSYKAHNLQLGFLKLLRGSPLFAQVDELGMVFCNDPPYQIISTPWMSAQELDILHNVEKGLSRTWNKGRFITALEYVLDIAPCSAFDLFLEIGKTISGYKTPLPRYTSLLFDLLSDMENVEVDILRDKMICDFLAMTGGKGMPSCLVIQDKAKHKWVEKVSALLGRKVDFDSVAMLSTGLAVYATGKKNAVDSLYETKVMK